MARKIRFPLTMKDGAEVRTLDELKENFDMEAVLGYFADGKLATWLADRYYDDKAEAVSSLSTDTTDLNKKLCEILEVEYQENEKSADLECIKQRNEKIRFLKGITDDTNIINNPDLVATNSDELFEILDQSPDKVYLYGEQYSIPVGAKNITYIGINNPTILIEKNKTILDYDEAGISFQNVKYGGTISPYFTEGELLFLKNKYKEAFPLIKKAAEMNNPRAMYILACYYNNCYEVVKYDEKTRNDWCQKAFSYNEPVSMYGYASWCLDNDKDKVVYSKIFNDIEEMAKSGDILAESILGYMYYNSEGVTRDRAKALEWGRKAAEQGDPAAQNLLGFDCDTWCRATEAIEWFRKAAEQGYAVAQWFLGGIYYNNDKAKAIEWYRKSAEQGNARAQNRLGDMYINGDGVTRDIAKAAEWYRKSSGQEFEMSNKCLIGKTINFGKYDGEKLKWRVLDIGSDSIYVLCETIICETEFDDSINNWNISLIRNWLNEEFYKRAFDNDEKVSIKEVNNDNVTLLSQEEVEELMTEQDRKVASDWWLRSTAPSLDGYACYVYSGGSLKCVEIDCVRGVRPALYLNI